MSILLIFENKNVTPWEKALIKALPEATIEIHPYVKNKADVEFIICWKPNKNVFDQYPNVKVVQSVGASIEHITNTQQLHKDSLVTRIIDEKLSNDMWEFLLTIVMGELKNTRIYLAQQSKKIWQQHQYKSISNTTVSILGLGQIGGHVAKQFGQMGFKVKGWSNSPKQIQNVKSYQGKDQFDAFLDNSDFLINILPLTNQTKGILNKSTFQKLPTDAFVINVGRGEHLIEDDLINMLETSMLSGAYLDVFKTEPLPKEHPFWKHPKIQITPHVASLTDVDSAITQIVENYKRFLNQEALLNRVSLDKGY